MLPHTDPKWSAVKWKEKPKNLGGIKILRIEVNRRELEKKLQDYVTTTKKVANNHI